MLAYVAQVQRLVRPILSIRAYNDQLFIGDITPSQSELAVQHIRVHDLSAPLGSLIMARDCKHHASLVQTHQYGSKFSEDKHSLPLGVYHRLMGSTPCKGWREAVPLQIESKVVPASLIQVKDCHSWKRIPVQVRWLWPSRWWCCCWWSWSLSTRRPLQAHWRWCTSAWPCVLWWWWLNADHWGFLQDRQASQGSSCGCQQAPNTASCYWHWLAFWSLVVGSHTAAAASLPVTTSSRMI
mmetsp:Transcript_23440/g.54133  ORF Transcript_23440/g.54133 Transcript_23440/m.54133 type:complete len:239 (-) Transcript_23440:128-844(-)